MAENLTGLDGLDALDAAASEATPVEAPVAPAVGNDKNALAKQGADIYRGLSTEQKSALNSGSNSVTFIRLLGAGSCPATRTENGQSGIPTCDVVGIRLKANVDLDVPVIKFLKPPHDIKKIPAFDSIQYRHIAAGQEFVLNRVEGMYLFTLPAYNINGYVAYEGEEKAVQFVPKLSKYFTTKGGLPTPTFKFTDSATKGSIKTNMELVDTEVNGKWELKPEYAGLFDDLFTVRAGSKVTDGTSSASEVPAGVKASLAIANLLTASK